MFVIQGVMSGHFSDFRFHQPVGLVYFYSGDTHRETSRDALLEFIVSTENLSVSLC